MFTCGMLEHICPELYLLLLNQLGQRCRRPKHLLDYLRRHTTALNISIQSQRVISQFERLTKQHPPAPSQGTLTSSNRQYRIVYGTHQPYPLAYLQCHPVPGPIKYQRQLTCPLFNIAFHFSGACHLPDIPE